MDQYFPLQEWQVLKNTKFLHYLEKKPYLLFIRRTGGQENVGFMYTPVRVLLVLTKNEITNNAKYYMYKTECMVPQVHTLS